MISSEARAASKFPNSLLVCALKKSNSSVKECPSKFSSISSMARKASSFGSEKALTLYWHILALRCQSNQKLYCF